MERQIAGWQLAGEAGEMEGKGAELPWSSVAGRVQPGKLPAEELITRGISDLERGVESPESLLVSIGAPRLRRLGLNLPPTFDSPEHRLYDLLRRAHGDAAHSRYNALVRRLVRYERSAGVAGSRRA